MADEALVSSSRGDDDLIPRPDPTALTATAVRQAKEDLRRELSALREVLEARMDRADTERKLLLQVMDERADGIERRFAERDARFAERDEHRVDAVRVALDAARELNDERDKSTEKASGKFEESVREQIGQIAALAEASRDVLDAKISTLKERLDRGEGAAGGAQGYRTERRLDTGQMVAIASTVAGFITIAVIILIATRGH
jgi:hypothetical protein